ncbi:MAG: hypothetical protein ACLSAP_09240, partial [Oscillospiraceae bacterium]
MSEERDLEKMAPAAKAPKRNYTKRRPAAQSANGAESKPKKSARPQPPAADAAADKKNGAPSKVKGAGRPAGRQAGASKQPKRAPKEHPKTPIKIISLGGLNEIGKNMT